MAGVPSIFDCPAYDANVDYKTLVYHHRCKGEWSRYKNDANDIEIMFRRLDTLYKKYPDPNYQWYRSAVSDRYSEWKKKYSDDFFTIKKTNTADEKVWLFVTINLNDSKYADPMYPDILEAMVEAVRTSQDKALSCYQMRMVIEKHRENGIHHHIHILMEGTEKNAPSYIAQRIFRLSAVKAAVDKETFIDVKTSWAKKFDKKCAPLTTCVNYIMGEKGTKGKIQNVEKDKQWREENALEHEYKNY